MNYYPTKGIFLIFITFIILAYPVGAALNTIAAGDTVFIGEQGLDISSQIPAVTAIGWWSPGNTLASSEPDYKVGITDRNNVYISPIEFSSRKGPWYSYPGRLPVFNVADPYIDIKIEDTTVNVDVTGKWAPRGDELRFRIETNLGDMTGRGVAGAPITINVQTPEGASLSSLINKAGTYNSLDISVTKSPEFTIWAWDTGNSQYNSGTYVIWAECNANRMKENYHQEGKTYSVKGNLLVQDQNPLISAQVPTTTPATQMTTRQTTKPTTAVTTKLTTTVPTVTTAIPPPTTLQETPEQTVTPSPSPTPTKAPLFGWCTILAGTIACALYALWRR
jgi:hypothetical protein